MQLQIEYPDSLPDLLQTTRPQFEAEARMAMAVKLFERQRLSSGLAARLAGVSRVEFLLDLHRYGVPMIDLDEAELRATCNMPSPSRLSCALMNPWGGDSPV